jgi:SAM-dependent methyltransferase
VTSGHGTRARPGLADHNYLQLRLLARHLTAEASLVGTGTVLDLGCGAKPYRSLFRGPYIGLDLQSFHDRPDCLAASEHLPVAGGAVDVVLSTQQLEHVEDPVAVLTEARRVLRDGGRLLLSTHGVWPYHPDPTDYWRWTEEGLVKLISGAGFTVERVHHQGELLATSVILAVYPLGGLRRGPAPVRAAGALLVAAANALGLVLDTLATRFRPRHYASPSYLVVARADG